MPDTTRFFDAVSRGDAPSVEKLIIDDPQLLNARDEQGVGPILKALYHRHQEVADAILRQNPTLDVFEAAALGRRDRLEEVLSGDAAIVNACSPDGFTPIALAAYFGREEAARFLIDRGADVNAVSRNGAALTALHAAAACGSATIAKLLLQAGADPNAKQQGGWTALHSAAKHGNRQLVDALTEFSADQSVAADGGETPAELARQAGHHDIAQRLSGDSQRAPEQRD